MKRVFLLCLLVCLSRESSAVGGLRDCEGDQAPLGVGVHQIGEKVWDHAKKICAWSLKHPYVLCGLGFTLSAPAYLTQAFPLPGSDCDGVPAVELCPNTTISAFGEQEMRRLCRWFDDLTHIPDDVRSYIASVACHYYGYFA